jgi:peptide/nickel transport system substrate-binding protein
VKTEEQVRRYVLDANRDHAGGSPGIERIEMIVERDPSVAVTRLLSGEADWLLEVGAEQRPLVTGIAGIRAGTRPLPVQRGILFNVRPGRLYFDVEARRAFDLCIDHEALATQLDEERPVAVTPYALGSWAQPAQPVATAHPRDVEAARSLLETAGWTEGPDGIRVRDGVRLSSSIAVRPSRIDLFSFANQAAAQLAECGIELLVEELDLTGDTMLTQLQWPNEFDTLLLARSLGVDPDTAVQGLESSRITTEENAADANPGGYMSALADQLIRSARETLDETGRLAAYADLAELLAEDVPYWPLWYETATSALSGRVRGPAGPIDPGLPRYDWDVADWTLEPPG